MTNDHQAMASLRNIILNKHRRDQERIQAIHSLRKFGRASLPYFKEILHNHTEAYQASEIRRELVNAVADMAVSQDDEAWEILISLLDRIVDRVVNVSMQALYGVVIAISKDELELADDLCRCLANRGGERVASLMKQLIQVDPNSMIPMRELDPALATSYYRRFRNNVLRHFSLLGEIAVPYLHELLNSPDSDLREIAAHALADINR